MSVVKFGFFAQRMICVAVLCIILAKSVASAVAAEIISFEDGKMDFISPDEKSAIEISGYRYLNGKHSLLWKWQPGGQIVIDFQTGFDPKAYSWPSLFSVWIYNEKPLPGAKVRFEFGRKGNNGKADCWFDFKLGFSGWRTCTVTYARDMEGKAAEGMDFVRIIAPDNAGAGQLWLDRMLSTADDPRFQPPDYQVDMKGRPFRTEEEIDFGVPPKPPKATAEQIKGMGKIRDRMMENVLGPWKGKTPDFDQIKKELAGFELEGLPDGSTRGRHVLFWSQWPVYSSKMTISEEKTLFENYVQLRSYGELMLRIAVLCKMSEDTVLRKELLEMFTLMSSHLLDQGWARGSAQGTTHHFGYESREWNQAVFLMGCEPEFRKSPIYQKVVDSLIWFAREERMSFSMDVAGYITKPNLTILDYYNTLVFSHLMLLLNTDNDDMRAALLAKFSAYISVTLARVGSGVASGGLKPDGTTFHHGGHYPAYSNGIISYGPLLANWLSGTVFALDPAACLALRKALIARCIFSNPVSGIGLCGRHPLDGPGFPAGGLLSMALAGDFFTGGPVDEELAAAYLRGVPEERANSVRLFGKEIKPEATPQGHWTFNYGCFGIHRFGEKMVTIKGHNKYVWPVEIYGTQNRYGRYQSNGGIQIMPNLPAGKNGFLRQGWDWNLNPGATVILLPLELLADGQRKSYLPFSGSSNLENCYGSFGFHLPPPGAVLKNVDPAFTAKKSAFCFDERIICLGSGITASDKAHPVATVLFQHALSEKNMPTWANAAQAVTAFPWEGQVAPGGWLMDSFGNGYLVVSGTSVKTIRRTQRNVGEGDFAAAWMEHGIAPKDAAYEYLVLLDATPEKIAKFATEMSKQSSVGDGSKSKSENQRLVTEARLPYEIIRKDAAAHAVRDTASGVTAAVLWEAGSNLKIGPLLSNSLPVIVMFRKIDTKSGMVLSVCDPDLNFGGCDGMSQPRFHRLVLEGGWGLALANERVKASRDGANTAIDVVCRDGQPVEFFLKQ